MQTGFRKPVFRRCLCVPSQSTGFATSWQAGRDEPAKFEIIHVPARAHGDVFASHERWKELGFDQALGRALRSGKRKLKVEALVRAMVFNRLCPPDAKFGYLDATRGYQGGFSLAPCPAAINLGALIRKPEPDFGLVECFLEGINCLISRHCGPAGILNEGLAALLTVPDRYTLANIMLPRERFDAAGGAAPRSHLHRWPFSQP